MLGMTQNDGYMANGRSFRRGDGSMLSGSAKASPFQRGKDIYVMVVGQATP